MEESAETTDTPSTDQAVPASDASSTGQQGMESIQSTMDAASEGATETFDVLASPAQTQPEVTVTTTRDLEFLKNFSISTVYIMGTSFILGVLFTVFILLVLDFMRRNSENNQ